jgi:hypothetical protein
MGSFRITTVRLQGRKHAGARSLKIIESCGSLIIVLIAFSAYISQKLKCVLRNIPESWFYQILCRGDIFCMNLYMHLRLNLPLWLSGADLSDNLVSKPPDFYMIMSEYTEVFTQMGGAQMYCHECRLLIDIVTKTKTDLPPCGRLNVRWHSEWHCSKGHLLYQEELGMSISRRSKEFTKMAQTL